MSINQQINIVTNFFMLMQRITSDNQNPVDIPLHGNYKVDDDEFPVRSFAQKDNARPLHKGKIIIDGIEKPAPYNKVMLHVTYERPKCFLKGEFHIPTGKDNMKHYELFLVLRKEEGVEQRDEGKQGDEDIFYLEFRTSRDMNKNIVYCSDETRDSEGNKDDYFSTYFLSSQNLGIIYFIYYASSTKLDNVDQDDRNIVNDFFTMMVYKYRDCLITNKIKEIESMFDIKTETDEQCREGVKEQEEYDLIF